MGANELTYFLAEPELTEVSLTKNLMACLADIRPIVIDHRRHLVGCWDETTDIMEESSKDSLFVGTCTKLELALDHQKI